MDGEETFLFFLNRRDWEPNPKLWRERQRCSRKDERTDIQGDAITARQIRWAGDKKGVTGRCNNKLFHYGFIHIYSSGSDYR